MKALLSLAAGFLALFAFAPAEAVAGPSRGDCRVHSSCGHCRQPVYSYYQPVRHVNRAAVYGWVPAHHRYRPGYTVCYTVPAPVRTYRYSHGAPVIGLYTGHRSLRDYNFYRSYPVSGGARFCR